MRTFAVALLVAGAGAAALTRAAEKPALPGLIRQLGQEAPFIDVIVKALSSRRERYEAAHSVVRLGQRARAAVPTLRALLKPASDAGLVSAALAAIGRPAQAAQRAVVPFLQHKDNLVRAAALNALAEFADDAALPGLAVFIEEENDRELVAAAEKAKDRVRLRQLGR